MSWIKTKIATEDILCPNCNQPVIEDPEERRQRLAREAEEEDSSEEEEVQQANRVRVAPVQQQQ